MLGIIKLIILGIYFTLMILITELIRLIVSIFSKKRAEYIIYRLVPAFIAPMRWLMGIHVKVHGKENLPEGNGHLITSNHLGYVELFSLLKYFPCAFVAKQEIGGWPLIGSFARSAGTIFVDRESGGMSPKYIREVGHHLKKDLNVWFAPEKTTSDGTWLRPFSSALFVAANQAKRYVVPSVFVVRKINRKAVTVKARERIAWFDIDGVSIPFEKQFMKFLNTWSVHLDYYILPAERPDYNDDSLEARRKFSNMIHRKMEDVLEEQEPDFHRREVELFNC